MRNKTFRKAFATKILLVLLLASTVSIGCSLFGPKTAVVELHPIEKTDIIRVKAGTVMVNAAGDTSIAPKDGWLVSDFYVEEVMKARVGK